MRPYVIAITGASGVTYGMQLIRVMLEMGYELALVISEQGRVVIQEELGVAGRDLVRKEGLKGLVGEAHLDRLSLYSPKDFTAPIASGSYPVQGMVIIPCSMGTCGALASGIVQNLIHRAADCVLKEGRKLVLVPRETPLHAGHLENLLKLSRLGASIVPAMPAFYTGARTLEDITDFLVGKVLDQLQIPHTLYPRWTGASGVPGDLNAEREG